MIKDIIDGLNIENGSKYKMDVLKKYAGNELLKRVLKMTYCKVSYTYGITMKNVPQYPTEIQSPQSLDWALDILETRLVTRETTGNDAIDLIYLTLSSLSLEDAQVLEKILTRDLRINMGKSNINKVFKNLIIKPPYMRCGLYNNKTLTKIKYPAYLQQKADGRFVSISVSSGEVTFLSRSGEEAKFPSLEKQFKLLPDGVYIGEMLVRGITKRSESNGMINSDNPPHNDIYVQLWDLISLGEYSRPKDKDNKTIYRQRIKNLKNALALIDTEHVELIETKIVRSANEALRVVSQWQQNDLEGGVLKDRDNIFIDHTSPTQLKMKLCIDADVRCTGFYEGKPGTKRVKTFGGFTYSTDDGKVQGRTSGFTDKQLKEFNSDREKYIGQIFTIEFNDITRSRSSETYALSHPRFIEFRDKEDTDTLERIQEMKLMAMTIKEKE